MAEERIEIRLAKAEREYVKVYQDFLRSQNLTAEEKLVYIALKSFVSYGKDSGQVYPSVDTLCKLTSLSRPRVTRTIDKLIEKGVVDKKRRGLTKSNLYTLADNPAMWEAETVEQMQKIAENSIQLSNEEMIRELERRGAIKIINVKKEPDCNPPKEIQSNSQINLNQENITIEKVPCQDTKSDKTKKEKYTTEMINDIFEYNAMINDYPSLQKEIDVVMNILYDTLNTSKETIRVSGENKPSQVVISRLMHLDTESIMYAIRKFNDQTNKVKDPSAYMLTLLYKAKDQEHLDIVNQFNHDMSKI